MAADYTWEKLHGAVLALAAHGTLADRLHAALRGGLNRLDATDFADFPDAMLGPRYDALVARLRARPLSPDDAADAAGELVAIYDAVARHQRMVWR